MKYRTQGTESDEEQGEKKRSKYIERAKTTSHTRARNVRRKGMEYDITRGQQKEEKNRNRGGNLRTSWT